jgi:signal transduction histidine kinase
MIRPAAQEKSHSLTLSMEPTDVRAYGDPRRLKQILINLLSNAVKFTEPGGSIALEVTEEERSVRFSVRDTGIGISKSDLPRLFKPFVQLDSSLGRRHGGSGLGLALVGRLAELHGGSVALESEPGRGTTVSVSVPSWATFQSTQSVPSTLET